MVCSLYINLIIKQRIFKCCVLLIINILNNIIFSFKFFAGYNILLNCYNKQLIFSKELSIEDNYWTSGLKCCIYLLINKLEKLNSTNSQVYQDNANKSIQYIATKEEKLTKLNTHKKAKLAEAYYKAIKIYIYNGYAEHARFL